MKIDLSQFQELYAQESTEHIATIERGLLDLRSAPDNIELLNTIFRSAHSIKGGAGSFGLENLVRFTHVLESLLDELRNGRQVASPRLIDAMLQSVDVLSELLLLDASQPMPHVAQSVLQTLLNLLKSETGDDAVPHGLALDDASVAPEARLYCVRFKPDPTIFDSGCNPLLLLRNLAALGNVVSCTLQDTLLPSLAELDTSTCYLSWVVELRTQAPETELRDVFEFVEHLAQVEITAVAEDTVAASTTPSPESALTDLPSTVREATVAAASAPVSAAAKRSASTGESSIRVPIDKVDRLVDLVGEIVIAQCMAEQALQNITPETLLRMRETASSLERSIRELHERVMSIRMLPIGSLFQRYTRTVYDIGKSTGKQVRLEVSGSETEIDKSMLELLADPMIHLVRNAVDHGLEMPDARIAAGKSAEGTVWLRAFHRAGRVVLQIEDDGAGIDPERVRAKAVERGLIAAAAEMTEAQLRMLIFEPGFSTRDEVSDLSGRGVGMDVVRRNIQQMSGTVSLDSTVGKGSCITIELPLTLAILDGLIVRTQDRRMVLPLLSVLETVSCDPDDMVNIVSMGEVFVLRGESIPIVRLAHFFDLPQDARDTEVRSLIVVIEAHKRKLGLVIDEVLGQQQIVLKSLETHLHRVPGLMGATILGDGTVAPILDVSELGQRGATSTGHSSSGPAAHALLQ